MTVAAGMIRPRVASPSHRIIRANGPDFDTPAVASHVPAAHPHTHGGAGHSTSLPVRRRSFRRALDLRPALVQGGGEVARAGPLVPAPVARAPGQARREEQPRAVLLLEGVQQHRGFVLRRDVQRRDLLAELVRVQGAIGGGVEGGATVVAGAGRHPIPPRSIQASQPAACAS